MTSISVRNITIKEVIERLQKGEKVYYNKEIYWTMVNNVLVKYYKNNCVKINDTIDLDNYYYLYILINEPFKIEVGKFYKTRAGYKVFCYYIEENVGFPCKFVAPNIEIEHFSTTKEGKRFTTNESDFDIIDYWKE